MFKGKLGIALISFDRPNYFEQTLRSLEEQSYFQDSDFHLFQDGQVNKFSGRIVTDRYLIDRSVKLFKRSRLKNKVEHIEFKNIGNALNQFNAVEFMSKNYEYFMVIEDDVVLSSDYLRLIRVMIDQYFSDPKIFSLSLSFARSCKKQDIDKNLDKVFFKNVHWWAECWSAKNWKKIRYYFMEYMEFVNKCDYRMRPSVEIKRFFINNGFDIPQTSQDAGKDFALFKTGLKRLTSVVNRGFYIGEYGLHFRPSTYKRLGFGDMKPFEFESDKILEGFNIC
jgi:hypothetical protein